MSFKEYKKLKLSLINKEIEDYWEKNKIFEKIYLSRKKNSKFIIFEGPPSLNGSPGIHHVISGTIKDIFCRYQTLNGKNSYRKSGWDTHGLPIELIVEKKLNIKKEDIGKKISIKNYNEKCKNFVNKNLKKWKNLFNKLGFFIDKKNYYITYSSKYMESLWWILEILYKKKSLYKDYIVTPYSPSAGTGLSFNELNFPECYKNITDLSITVQFELKKKSFKKNLNKIKEKIYFLSWTTTPWTIPSNTALAVCKNLIYVLIKTYNPYNLKLIYVIISEESIKNIFYKKKYFKVKNEKKENFLIKDKKIPYTIILLFKGKYLIGCEYKPILKWVFPINKNKNDFKIVDSEFVNPKEGTGIIHISPTFGIEDFILSKKNKISLMLVKHKKKITPIVDKNGKYIDILPSPFSGKYIKKEFDLEQNFDVDKEISILLKKENKIFDIKKYNHSYPHCWRTAKPIIYYPINSWIIKTKKFKKDIISLNNKINWIPNFKGKKFFYWIKNIKNWNLSRSRYWGTPIPFWKSKKNEKIFINSIEMLINEINKSIKAGFMKKNPFKNFVIGDMSNENYKKIDLHRHILDDIILCSNSGEKMIRENDVIDVWFESGAMPYASLHYPFENNKNIKNFFTSDFISEGIDQTRGWFYTLHIISSILFKKISYKNVLPIGLILDKQGKKMSKTKGNIIDPFKIIEEYGSDVIRWYMVSNSNPWENIKFNIEDFKKIQKFFGTLHNVYIFFSTYANIDKFIYLEKDILKINELDKWILSELNLLIKNSKKYYEEYNITKIVKKIENFVINKLSNWYIRLSRRIFWKSKYNEEKISAYQTLYKCLITITKISSPIAPFYMEKLYLDLSNPINTKNKFDSVHLSFYPRYNNSLINENLNKKFSLIRKLTSMILSIRKKEKIKVRKPLKKAFILINSNNKKNIDFYSLNLLKKEVNIKNIYLLKKEEYDKLEITVKNIKPNYKILGPKFTYYIKDIEKILRKFTQEEIKKIEKKGYYNFFLEKKKITIFLNEVIIENKNIKNWSVKNYKEITVAIDINLDNNLIQEGFIRDFIRKIQFLRKKERLHITERIILYIYSSNKIEYIIKNNKKLIFKELLVKQIFFKKKLNYKKIKIDNNKIGIFIKKI
ncbi:isoleucine--tRNA ligase [Candidatus Shikimatogenerans silvanidophilus]|uniref:isoleucine--tRNA ligase n=1 Tax=Candidatus Shikimatogenerans silvanidophilus TaxID=2782547 RepID=UPI001BAA6B39|nr:isoleucine--tRNA ligase [Candidatus Shikimatogenerans silvanidophilus]